MLRVRDGAADAVGDFEAVGGGMSVAEGVRGDIGDTVGVGGAVTVTVGDTRGVDAGNAADGVRVAPASEASRTDMMPSSNRPVKLPYCIATTAPGVACVAALTTTLTLTSRVRQRAERKVKRAKTVAENVSEVVSAVHGRSWVAVSLFRGWAASYKEGASSGSVDSHSLFVQGLPKRFRRFLSPLLGLIFRGAMADGGASAQHPGEASARSSEGSTDRGRFPCDRGRPSASRPTRRRAACRPPRRPPPAGPCTCTRASPPGARSSPPTRRQTGLP